MTDIDDRLQQAAERFDTRQVPDDFTARVLAEIRANPNTKPKKGLLMNLLQKPVIAVAVAALVILGGGTTYAATDGFTKPFNLNNIFGYQDLTDNNGAKIIRVKTSNCDSTPNPAAQSGTSDRDMYFRIKDAKAASTEQFTRWVQGYCEQYQYDLKNGDINSVLAEYDSRNLDGSKPPYVSNLVTESGLLGVVPEDKAVSISWIEAPANSHNANAYGVVDPEVVIRDWKGDNLKFSDLKSDRYASVVFREAKQDQLNDQAVYIYQSSSNGTFYQKNREKIAKSVERVLPCKSHKSGYCTTKQATAIESGKERAVDTRKKDQNSKAEQAVSAIEQAYGWYNLTMPGSDHQTLVQSFGERYTTPELASSLLRPAPYDTIMCVQQAPGEGQWYSFLEPQVSGNLVTVVLRANATEDLEAMGLGEVTYDTTKGKISSIDCSPDM